MTTSIKLIVGLGNPGTEHSDTRHNAGFWCVDAIADEYGGQFRQDAKFHGETCRVKVESEDCWLLKPTTYMNHSGRSVQAMVSFYKLSISEVLIIHDEIDLDPGTARLKTGGGHGGQNGLRDIINQLGDKSFARLRIGVGHPGDKHKVVNHVLGRASRDDQEKINQSIEQSLHIIPYLIQGEMQRAMTALHTRD